MSKHTTSAIGLMVGYENATPFRRMVDGDGNALDMTPDERKTYFEEHPVYAAVQPQTVDGQEMIRIPAFYVKTFAVGDNARVYALSAEGGLGWFMHPAFRFRGADVPCFLVGAYEGSLDGDMVMCSLPGKPTAGSRGFHDMRASCLARNKSLGDGWDMLNIYQFAALQRLIMIEAGTTDVQSAIHSGNTDCEKRLPTGESGCVHRGIHDFWGNAWCMIHGLETNEKHEIFLLDNEGFSEMLPTGVVTPCLNRGFITAMHDEQGAHFDFDDIFLPKATTEEQEAALFPDRCWPSWPEERNVLYVGGAWNGGSGAGLFCWGLNNPASNGHAGVGCRLARIVL